MGLKGRERRLKHFERRAEAFTRAIDKEGYYEGQRFSKWIQRDKRVKIGVGEHKRLVEKRLGHVGPAKIVEASLKNYLKKNKITPKYYSLVEIGASSKFKVQEYFNKPSAAELDEFLRTRQASSKEKRISKKLSRKQALLCKSFVNQHKGITLEKLQKAIVELQKHCTKIPSRIALISTNAIVLGLTKEGKIRLAVVDI